MEYTIKVKIHRVIKTFYVEKDTQKEVEQGISAITGIDKKQVSKYPIEIREAKSNRLCYSSHFLTGIFSV